MTTASLNITLVIEGQTGKEGTIATSVENLEKATQRILAVDLAAGHVTLTGTQFTRSFYFNCTGHSAARDLSVPLQVNGADAAERFFVVKNGGTGTITVKPASGGGTTVAVPAGKSALLMADGTNVFRLKNDAEQPIDIASGWPGTLTASAEVLRFTAVRAFTIPVNMAGSKCKVGTNPTSTAVLDVKKNGSNVGSISINTSGVASFSMASATSFAADDVLLVVGPASPDATLAGVGVTLVGERG